jgi:hypothetical protein
LERYEENKNKKAGKIGEFAHVNLISGEGKDNLKAKLQAISTQFKNPFIHISNWIKQEQYTLDALISCISYMQSIDGRKAKTQLAIRDIDDEISKLNSGKFTFGSIFKDEAGKKAQAIEREKDRALLEMDVFNYDVIKKILTIYLATIAIPDFQRNAKRRYAIAMGYYCDTEVHNAETIAECWDSFKQVIDSFGIKY